MGNLRMKNGLLQLFLHFLKKMLPNYNYIFTVLKNIKICQKKNVFRALFTKKKKAIFRAKKRLQVHHAGHVWYVFAFVSTNRP